MLQNNPQPSRLTVAEASALLTRAVLLAVLMLAVASVLLRPDGVGDALSLCRALLAVLR